MPTNTHSILSAKLGIVKVESPALAGHTVFVREVSAVDRYEVLKIEDGPMRLPKLAAIAICDEAGNRIFDESAVEQLGQLPPAMIDAICQAWLKLNGLGSKATEDKEKNS